MRVVSCLLVFMVLGIAAPAQKVYFIYLQSDNSSSFYVKLGDRILTSVSPGYLILPNLVDSSYQLQIGSPAAGKESRFTVPLKGKDRGFLIRNFDFGMGLFDLQTLSVIRPLTDDSGKGISYRPRNDDFTYLLSKAANDTTLLFVALDTKPETVVRKDPPKKEEVQVKETVTPIDQPVLVKDTFTTHPAADVAVKKPDASEITGSTVNNGDAGIIVNPETRNVSPDSSVKSGVEPEYRRSHVVKHAESSTSEGFGLVFYDVHEEGSDTVRLLIPNPRIQFRKSEMDTVQDSGMMELKKEIPVESKKASAGVSQGKQDKLPPCRAIATDADFFKLRKTMAAKSSDDGMIDEARKYFKGKCFSTEQVRHLGTLFLTSAGKYQFFEAAMRHVSDTDQFKTLGAELHDDYYSKQFKTLVGD